MAYKKSSNKKNSAMYMMLGEKKQQNGSELKHTSH